VGVGNLGVWVWRFTTCCIPFSDGVPLFIGKDVLIVKVDLEFGDWFEEAHGLHALGQALRMLPNIKWDKDEFMIFKLLPGNVEEHSTFGK